MHGTLVKISRLISLRWLTGPVFDKELRVSSRRKRYYLLRVIYVIALLVIIGSVWLDFSGSYFKYEYATQMSAYMAEMARLICAGIADMQFYVTQIAAILLLSNSISEEASNRSLAVLLSTPITSFQIVGGKVTSKLLQVLLLLCLSLPVLGVIRVFGGIPWDFVVKTTCITMVAVLFVSAVTILVATFFRRAHTNFIVTMTIICLYYGMIYMPIVSGLVNRFEFVDWIEFNLNPYYVFRGILGNFTGRGGRIYWGAWSQSSVWISFWPFFWCCLENIALSFFIFLLAAWRVRKISLRQLTGDRSEKKRRILKAIEACINILPRISRQKPRRTVRGQCVVWKEMHNSLFRSELLRGRYIYLLLAGAIVILYSLFMLFAVGDMQEVVWAVIVLSAIIALLLTAITSAVSISAERETSSWHILLCTPLTDADILWGKMTGVLRKIAAVWLYIFIFIAIMIYARVFPLSALFLTAIIAFGYIGLLVGMGMYFGVICKTGTKAVMAVLIIAGLLWIGPLVFAEMSRFNYYDTVEMMMSVNPVIQMIDVCEGDLGHYFEFRGAFIVFCAIVNFAVGCLFIWRAKRKIRTKIF